MLRRGAILCLSHPQALGLPARRKKDTTTGDHGSTSQGKTEGGAQECRKRKAGACSSEGVCGTSQQRGLWFDDVDVDIVHGEPVIKRRREESTTSPLVTGSDTRCDVQYIVWYCTYRYMYMVLRTCSYVSN